jgi:hypothetical protein
MMITAIRPRRAMYKSSIDEFPDDTRHDGPCLVVGRYRGKLEGIAFRIRCATGRYRNAIASELTDPVGGPRWPSFDRIEARSAR